MKSQPKPSLFIVTIVLLFLSIGGVTTRANNENQTLYPPRGQAAEFFYLPFVTNFPPVWFVKDAASPSYLQNYANNAGCNWLGIAGEVSDLQGDPVPVGIYNVHVWESGIDNRVLVGGAPVYGPSGYEIFLFDSPRVQDHKLQLVMQDGRPVSPIYDVQTRATCYENLLYFVFIQNN